MPTFAGRAPHDPEKWEPVFGSDHAPAFHYIIARLGQGRHISAMRLKAGIWVAAYIRRCQAEGAFAVVRRRGAEEAGAIFIKIDRRDGTADVYGPAPQTAFEESHPADRAFTAGLRTQPAPEADAEAYLAKQISFDPDIWIIEVEDRGGRHFLDQLVR